MRILLLLSTLAAPLLAQQPQTGFLDRSVVVAGATYRYQVYVPATYAGSQRWPVILFLHGGGERGSDNLIQTQVGIATAIRKNVASYPAIVIFPQVPRDSIWTGVPGDVAIAALDRTLSEFSTDPDRVYLTGMSLGGNGTWYLAYRYPDRFAAIAPVCAFVTTRPGLRGLTAVPPDAGEPFAALAKRLVRVPTWIFHGEVDPVVPVTESRQAAEALKAAGGNVRYTEFLGVDHFSWDQTYASKQFQEWLFAQRRSR
jgi:predicted peptidase